MVADADNPAPVFSLDMEPASGFVKEAVSGKMLPVNGIHKGEKVKGVDGLGAMRFDSYSTFVSGNIDDILPDKHVATFSVWVAPETYPKMAIDMDSDERVPLLGFFSDETDIAIWLGQNGEYSFMCKIGGEKYEPQYVKPLPCYQWSNLTGIVDGNAGKIYLLCNGEEVSSMNIPVGSRINFNSCRVDVGHLANAEDSELGLKFFNGIIDDIKVYNAVVTPTPRDLQAPVLAVPRIRFNDRYGVLRPTYHAMPTANWTNEPHGLLKYKGKYHIFHQRNANGTYMARQHWGHLVSDNLYEWSEAPVALFPSGKGSIDVKGCWSGCVVNDPDFNNGIPRIFYTGVDYAKAVICQADMADSQDENMVSWTKTGTVISGKPTDYDDFRDPFVFKADDGTFYMVIGDGKKGKGCLVLYRLSGSQWQFAGEFFSDPDGNLGEMWEMPTVCKMDGKWVVTVSTINSGDNNTYYWIGSIDSNGRFVRQTPTRKVEFEGFAKSGYGMMSPSIMQQDGKTVTIGIVPDKLPTATDIAKGWSHTFSLPREWSVSSDNYLLQKPFSGLASMRKGASVAPETSATLNGSMNLPVADGRQCEASATFTAQAGSQFGFKVFSNGGASTKVVYDMASGKFKVDMNGTAREMTDNDAAVSPGNVFSSSLPKGIREGEEVKIHIFVDHSIIDIFVNDSWASSVRVFATDAAAKGLELFASSSTPVKDIQAFDLEVREMPGIASDGQSGMVDPGIEPGQPGDDPLMDPTNRYEVDENGRDLKLQSLTGRGIVLLLRSGNLDANEQAALDFFLKELPQGMVYRDDLPAELPSRIQCIWVHVDGSSSTIPFSPNTIANLRSYTKNGGNLYLTGFATQLVESIGRTSGMAPNIVSTEYTDNPDTWYVKATLDNSSSHYLFRDMYKDQGFNVMDNYPVIGGENGATKRIDHNCLWNLESLSPSYAYGAPRKIAQSDFENRTNSKVLGTWGGNDDTNVSVAGIVDFSPTADYKGKILANGIAGANQFSAPDGKSNWWDYNQKRMLNNALVALAPDINTSVSRIEEASESPKVVAVDGGFAYSNVVAGSSVYVYTPAGMLAGHSVVGESGTVQTDWHGMLIVKIVAPAGNTQTYKIIVK